MNADTTTVFFARHERKIIFSLALAAAVRVFIFSAALPLFTNVDEDAHFDLVVKYSHGHIPDGLDAAAPESANDMALYGTREFLDMANQFPDKKFPPPALAEPVDDAGKKLFAAKVAVRQGTNHENSQAPLYYALAGAWFNLGKFCGLHGADQIYWLRFLNCLFVAALVWTAWRAARTVFPENNFLRLAVPALAAFLPQTTFFMINNDVLSPLCCGAAFVCLVQWLRAEIPGVTMAAATGLLLAAGYLVKISNAPLLAVAALAVICKCGQLAAQKNLRANLPAFTVLALTAGLPVCAWRALGKIHFGDPTGSALKMKLLGWTAKPFADWWPHPLFTPHGCWTFFSELIASFWQGELWWHGRPLASPVLDFFFVLLTAAFIGCALPSLFRRTGLPAGQRSALRWSLVVFASGVMFFAVLSLMFDFHGCVNPSRAHPYFVSGRLLLGALVPFLLVFGHGLDAALNRFGPWQKYFLLAALLAGMLAAGTAVNLPVFANPWNWFHL